AASQARCAAPCRRGGRQSDHSVGEEARRAGHGHRRAAALQGRGVRAQSLRRDGGAHSRRAARERDRAGHRPDGRRTSASARGRADEGRGEKRGRPAMKYGLRIPSFALGPRTATLAEMGRYLRRAEDLKFEAAVTIDHLLLTPPAYATTWLEPLSMLSALAGVTRTIRLRTMVLFLPPPT